MNTPLLSVCIITYNHKDYIREAIDSVLAEEVDFTWEIIIADDYSTDGTRDILLEYKSKYPDIIKLILQERNVGAAKNWIQLISEPKAKYIAYFEGDDYWTSNQKLKKQVDFLESNESYSGCFHNTLIIGANIEPKVYGEYHKSCYTLEDTLGSLALFHTSSFIFRRNALVLPDWLLKMRSGDMILFTIIAKSGNIHYIPETMSIYRKHGTGISVVKEGEGVAMNQHHISRLRHIDAFLDYKYSKVINQTIKHYKKELFYYTKLGKLTSKIRIRSRLKNIFRR